jgi:hypothetical protein
MDPTPDRLSLNPDAPSGPGLSDAFRRELDELVRARLRARREAIVARVNAAVNLPLLGEGSEAKLFGTVVDLVIDAVDAVL